MEFWGVEVKCGKPLAVHPTEGKVIHLSQACLGETKVKGKESVCLSVNINNQKLVLGTLSTERIPQQQYDLVFDKDFELSHNWKNGSVYFYGYRASNTYDDSDEEPGFDFEDHPLNIANNGNPGSKPKQEKPTAAEKADGKSNSAAGKQKVKIVEPMKDDESDDEDDSSDAFEDIPTTDESDSSENEFSGSDVDLEDDDDSGEDDEETPQKKVESKKRPAESASKTPVPEKKAKLVTPQKTDGKKGGVHVATPHPSKQAGKTPANQSKQQSPKSAGSVSCSSCPKKFNSAQALESHTKAKHSAGK